MVKISVIIPVYNAAPFLEEAMASLFNQTFKDFEMVCVNDGSKDNSLEILENFAKKDNRIKLINQENAGCGAARNRALDEAEGDYIYFFDPDDLILPNTFEDLYNNAVNNGSDLVIFKIARFEKMDEINYEIPGFEFEKIFKNVDFDDFTFNYKDIKPYVLNSSFAPWTKLYNKKFLDKYGDFRFPTDVAFDDTPFHVQSMLRAEKISYIPEFYYNYRFNPNSINNTSSNGMDIFRICNVIEKFLKDNGYYCEFINEFKLFKITQILNYCLTTATEEYFKMAQKEFSTMHLGKNHIIPAYKVKRYNLILNSQSFEEYKIHEHNLLVNELKWHHNRYRRKRQQLINKNKKLKKDLSKASKLNKKLLNSKSWKLTSALRNFKR